MGARGHWRRFQGNGRKPAALPAPAATAAPANDIAAALRDFMAAAEFGAVVTLKAEGREVRLECRAGGWRVETSTRRPRLADDAEVAALVRMFAAATG